MSGLFSQLGLVAETTYGTPVVVTRFYPLVDESLSQEIDRMESEGIIAGQRVIRSQQWAPGRVSVTGDVGLEWYQQFTGLLWSHMLGSITSTAAAGIATHTATPGDLTGKSLTVQMGRAPSGSSTALPFTYLGCKVQSWELAVATGEIATLGLTLLAQTETDGIALAAASYGADAGKPFTYVQGAVSISGSSVCVRELQVSGENSLADDRECIGQAFIDQPLEMDLRTYEGTATLEFTSMAMYDRFVDGVEAPIVLSMSASASAQAVVTMNARFDGVTPNVDGRDLIVVDVPFKCIGTTTDASAITVVLKNSQTSP